jgi:ABC-2 type transport system permease protein
MIASTRAELLRLGKWPVTWVVIGVWLTLNLSFGYVFDYLAYRDAVGAGDARAAAELLDQLSTAGVPATMVAGLPLFGGALALVLAALATGSGFGWSTWRTVLAQGTGRLAALGGTLAALAAVLVLLAALTLVVDLAASALVMRLASQPLTWPGVGTLAEGAGGALLIVGMWAAAGALVGLVTRSPAPSIGLGLVWALVVENLLRGVASLLGPLEVLTDLLPGTAAGSLAGAIGAPSDPAEGGAPGVLDVLGGGQSVALLAAWLGAFLLVAVLVMARRDV